MVININTKSNSEADMTGVSSVNSGSICGWQGPNFLPFWSDYI